MPRGQIQGMLFWVLSPTRTQQAMVNSIEYATLEDQARSKYAYDINAALVASVSDDDRDNAGDEPYQLDGYESSSTNSSDSLNQIGGTME